MTPEKRVLLRSLKKRLWVDTFGLFNFNNELPFKLIVSANMSTCLNHSTRYSRMNSARTVLRETLRVLIRMTSATNNDNWVNLACVFESESQYCRSLHFHTPRPPPSHHKHRRSWRKLIHGFISAEVFVQALIDCEHSLWPVLPPGGFKEGIYLRGEFQKERKLIYSPKKLQILFYSGIC